MHENLDFRNEKIGKLFRMLCIPTTISMLISALYILADGMFIGKGLGQNGIAAVNIIVPLIALFSGLGVMLGFGASTLSSIEMAKEKFKESSSIFSQTFKFTTVFMALLAVIIIIFSDSIVSALGASPTIHEMSSVYLKTMIAFLPFYVLSISLAFFIRVDGAPKFAMIASLIGGIINIILDYTFIFPLGMGMFGAALATGIGNLVAATLMIYYLVKKSNVIKLIKTKMQASTLLKASAIGFPGLLTELSLSIATVAFNLILISNFNEAAVSAYGIINYTQKLVIFGFMGIAYSMQPIIAYNFGNGLYSRVKETLRISTITAALFGLGLTALGFLLSHGIVGGFLDSNYEAYGIAVKGLPIYYLGFAFLGVNMMGVAYFQSIRKPNFGTIITALRGAVFVVVALLILPNSMGITGIWLAVPVAEILGSVVIYSLLAIHKKNEGNVKDENFEKSTA